MSGICGIVRFDQKRVMYEDIKKMVDSFKYSGTDCEGVTIKENVGFGHKMLWTTPESKLENQPTIDTKNSLILTSDARIDNREELFEKLDLYNKFFGTVTDADLIIFAYQKWDEECVHHLIGDFAFSIWDENRQKLFCARDHMGIKQFYYHFSEDKFIYASEISPIFCSPHISKSPNLTAIQDFLGTIALRHEDTFFKNIFRLPQAHTLSITNNKVEIKRYWFPERIKINRSLNMEDASKKLNELFTQAVSVRLRSAYPVGGHLSGGLDSSSVMAIASELKGKDLITSFSTHFGEMGCDESKYSNAMIQKLGINAVISRGDKIDFKDIYTIDRYNREFPDWPGAGLFITELPILEEARTLNIRVMLTGQGGDHLFTGNTLMLADCFKQMQWIRLYKELKYYGLTLKNLKHLIVIPLLPENVKKFFRIILQKKKKVDIEKISQLSLFDDMEKMDIHKEMPRAQEKDLRILLGMGNAMWMSQSSSNFGGRYNIEYRHPFFDKRLIEFALSLPPEMKLSQGIIKVILRRSMGEKLTDIVSRRSDKAEFSDLLKKQIDALSKDEISRLDTLAHYGLATENKVSEEYENFKANKLKHIMFFWNKILIYKWLCYNIKK